MSEAITTGVTDVVELVGTAFTAITGNPILCIFLGASLLGVALSVFSRMKSAIR